MSTLAKPSQGTLLQMADATGGNFATIAEVKDIGVDMTAQVEDVTCQTSGGWRVKITTLKSYGPVTFPVNWVPGNSTHNNTTGIMYVFSNGVERNFKLVDPDLGTLVTFPGVISDIKGGMPVAGVKNASVTIQSSGAPTIAI